MPTEIEEEMKENPCAHIKDGQIFGEWKVVGKKLDEGGFGMVFKMENRNNPGQFAALKAESNDIEGGPAIKLELLVLKTMAANGVKTHIPHVYHAAKHKTYSYMIMTLLGSNLKMLRIKCPNKLMSQATWSRIAVQCLYGIKYVHDNGFIHRGERSIYHQ